MDEPCTQTYIIPMQLHGLRIDVVLATLLSAYSRSWLTTCLKNNQIMVNRQSIKPKDKVKAGDIINVLVDLSKPSNQLTSYSPEAIDLSIVYDDEHLLVINKPAGLVVHPGAGNFEHTLVNALVHFYPQLKHLPRAGLIHRLDKDTTGLLIIAKTLSSYAQLIRQMQTRLIKRHYSALVHGHIIAGAKIETCYGRHPTQRLKMAVCRAGKTAVTLYTVEKRYHQVTLINIELLTGRTHQIRVHMAHINHPVIGDKLYGRQRLVKACENIELTLGLTQFPRQALHAKTLVFAHPVTDKPLVFHAPLPEDFQQLIDLLNRSIHE